MIDYRFIELSAGDLSALRNLIVEEIDIQLKDNYLYVTMAYAIQTCTDRHGVYSNHNVILTFKKEIK